MTVSKVPRINLDLRVTGNLDHDVLTQSAATKPTVARTKAECLPVVIAQGRAFDEWRLAAEGDETLDSAALLDSIRKRIMGRAGTFARAIQAMGACSVLSYCVEVDESKIGDIKLRWPKNQLAFVSALGAPIDIDFYCYDAVDLGWNSDDAINYASLGARRSRLRWSLVVRGSSVNCNAVTCATGLEPTATSKEEWRCDEGWVYGCESKEYGDLCQYPYQGDFDSSDQVSACAEIMLRWRMGVQQRLALKRLVFEEGLDAMMVLQVECGFPVKDVILHLGHGAISAMSEAGVGASVDFC